MTSVPVPVSCALMTPGTRDAAQALLGEFLGADAHYLASASAYGDGGIASLARALDLFLAHPEIGFVFLALTREGERSVAVGACVCCYAISTARGALVVKLDDVTVAQAWQRRGVGSAMLRALVALLRDRGVARIDSACHRDNAGAWRFYERLGFRSLEEERIALLLDGNEQR